MPDYFAETQYDQESSVLLRWQERKDMVERFKELWLKQYLPQLQVRQKWRTKHQELKLGDLVLLETENLKQFQWPVARVVDLIRSPDGIVRTVRVRTKNSSEPLRRNIHEIFPLEASGESHMTPKPPPQGKLDDKDMSNQSSPFGGELQIPENLTPLTGVRRSARIAVRNKGEQGDSSQRP